MQDEYLEQTEEPGTGAPEQVWVQAQQELEAIEANSASGDGRSLPPLRGQDRLAQEGELFPFPSALRSSYPKDAATASELTDDFVFAFCSAVARAGSTASTNRFPYRRNATFVRRRRSGRLTAHCVTSARLVQASAPAAQSYKHSQTAVARKSLDHLVRKCAMTMKQLTSKTTTSLCRIRKTKSDCRQSPTQSKGAGRRRVCLPY